MTIKIPFCSTFIRYYLFHYVVETFDFVDEILFCVNSNETSLALLSHATICFSVFNKMNFGFVSLTFT